MSDSKTDNSAGKLVPNDVDVGQDISELSPATLAQIVKLVSEKMQVNDNLANVEVKDSGDQIEVSEKTVSFDDDPDTMTGAEFSELCQNSKVKFTQSSLVKKLCNNIPGCSAVSTSSVMDTNAGKSSYKNTAVNPDECHVKVPLSSSIANTKNVVSFTNAIDTTNAKLTFMASDQKIHTVPLNSVPYALQKVVKQPSFVNTAVHQAIHNNPIGSVVCTNAHCIHATDVNVVYGGKDTLHKTDEGDHEMRKALTSQADLSSFVKSNKANMTAYKTHIALGVLRDLGNAVHTGKEAAFTTDTELALCKNVKSVAADMCEKKDFDQLTNNQKINACAVQMKILNSSPVAGFSTNAEIVPVISINREVGVNLEMHPFTNHTARQITGVVMDSRLMFGKNMTTTE